jgi:acyl carrier protein
MADSTYEAVKQALANQLNLDPSEIKPESLLADDLDADSLDAVELIIALEESYGVEIETEDAEALKTVGDIVALLDRLSA